MAKDTTADCLILNINTLNRDSKGVSCLKDGIFGTITWTNGSSISVRTEFDILENQLQLHLSFAKKGVNVDQLIDIAYTPMPNGGKRLWFKCPFDKSGFGDRCGRLVGRLYIPYYAYKFGCRHCYDLVYESQQEWTSPKFKALFDSFKLIHQLESERKFKKRMSKREREKLNQKYEKLIELFRKAGIKLYDE